MRWVWEGVWVGCERGVRVLCGRGREGLDDRGGQGGRKPKRTQLNTTQQPTNNPPNNNPPPTHKQNSYTTKFGIVHVDYEGGTLARTPKSSALWLSRHFFSQGASRMAL